MSQLKDPLMGAYTDKDDDRFVSCVEKRSSTLVYRLLSAVDVAAIRETLAVRQTGKSFGSKFAGEHGLTVFTGVLAILSTILGGGIVGIPFMYMTLGIPLAITLSLIMVYVTSISSSLYLRVKDMLPD